MRSIITSVLLFSILLPTFSPWGTIAYFNLNREYIAKVLCENRDKPKLNCNGKCYLAKILKQQQDKQNKETTERVQNLPVLQLFSNPLPAFAFLGFTSPDYSLRNNFCYRLETYPSPSFGILRPPKGCWKTHFHFSLYPISQDQVRLYFTSCNPIIFRNEF